MRTDTLGLLALAGIAGASTAAAASEAAPLRTCGEQFEYVLAQGDVLERVAEADATDTCCAKCVATPNCSLFSFGGAWKGKANECVLLRSFSYGDFAGPGGFIYTTVTMSDYAGPAIVVSVTPPAAVTPSPSVTTQAPAPATSSPVVPAPATAKPQC